MKRFYRLFAILFVAAMLLSACTSTNEDETEASGEEAESSDDQINLTWWVDASSGTETANCIIEVVADSFNETNTDNIYVETTLQANAWNAVRTAVAGGGGPDIIYTPGPSYVFEMAVAGQLYPMDEFAEEFGWDEQFQSWALDLGIVDDHLYSVPNEIETMVLYYNKTVFEENGWTVPTTTDEWFDLMYEAQEAGYIANAAGNSEWQPTDEWYVTVFLNEYAGSDNVYKALIGEMQWTDQVFVDAIDKLTEAMTNGLWQNGLDYYYTATTDEFITNLGDGEAVMMVSGTWYVGYLNEYFGTEAGNENDWDWAPVPSMDGTAQYDLGIGSTYSINGLSENPEAAAKFLTHFFSTEIQAELITECGMNPAPVNITAEDLTDIDERRARLIEATNAAAGAGQYGYTTWTFWPAESDAYIYDEIEKVWAGTMTTEEYLQGLQEVFDAEFEAGDVLHIPTRE